MESIESFEKKYNDLINLNVLRISKNVDLTICDIEPYIVNIIAFDGLYKKRFFRTERVNITNKIKVARQEAIKLGYNYCDKFLFIKEK